MGEPPLQVTSGVTITYEAMTDPSGSINTISSTKTNFWSYVRTLFLTSPPPDIGMTGNSVQNLTPHPLTYDSTNAILDSRRHSDHALRRPGQSQSVLHGQDRRARHRRQCAGDGEHRALGQR